MSLFKISRGLAKDLPSKKTSGWCWLTTDDGKFYVDISDSERICINNIPTQLSQLLEDDNHKLITSEQLSKLANIAAGAEVNVQSDWSVIDTSSDAYIANKPTLGTASSKDVATTGDASSTQVVLGNDSRLTDSRNAADVYDWAKASTKPSYTATEVGAIASTLKGANNGVAELDSSGKVPSSQLPSYVDDVVECEDTSHFPITGESGKIYIDQSTNKTYRWGGTDYVEISASLALGETASTAYRGDRGKTAYDHATDSDRLTTANNSGFYKISVTSEGHVGSVTSVSKSDITGLGVPGSDTTYTSETTSVGSASSWSAGSIPTLGTEIPADDITAWSTGTLPSLAVSEGTLYLNAGTLPSLSYTAKSIPNVTDVGTAPSLTITNTDVVTGITAN